MCQHTNRPELQTSSCGNWPKEPDLAVQQRVDLNEAVRVSPDFNLTTRIAIPIRLKNEEEEGGDDDDDDDDDGDEDEEEKQKKKTKKKKKKKHFNYS